MKLINCAPEADKSGHYGFHNIRDAFQRFGFEVIDFDFLEEEKRLGRAEMHRRLKQLVDQEQPEIFYHAVAHDELDVDLLDYITHKTATTSLTLFRDDDWRLDHSLKWVGHYNFAITTVREALPDYQRQGHSHVLFAQLGCNPYLYRPLDAEKLYDVTFVGQASAGRPELIKFLRARGVNMRVWGTGWEQYKELRLVAGGFLPTYKVVELFAQSKIVLGMAWTAQGLRPQIKGRTFEYAASRAFQLTNYDERLKEYFAEGKEIVFYRDPEALLEKIHYYLAHGDARAQIARNAWARALREHTWTSRWQSIFHSLATRRPPSKKSIDLSGHEKSLVARPAIIAPPTAPEPPLVSVITYVHNVAEFLDELIPSVLNQTYTHFEYLLLDDGSTDATREVVSKYLVDKRLRYVYQESTGQGGRFIHRLINKCLSLTRGDLVCMIGGDDVFMPNRLARHVEEFVKDKDLDIAFSEGQTIDAQGRICGSGCFGAGAHAFNRWNLARLLLKYDIIPHPTVMMRRSCIDKVGLFEDGFAADYQFWLKSAAYLKFKFIDEPLIKYRIHEKATSTNAANRSFVATESARILRSARQRYSILDLYPEIEYCRDKEKALAEAYTDLGMGWLTGNFPAPEQAIAEFKKALEHNPRQVEALNNLGVCLMALGNCAEGIAYFERAAALGEPSCQNNLRSAREAIQRGAPPTLDLLKLNPGASELFQVNLDSVKPKVVVSAPPVDTPPPMAQNEGAPAAPNAALGHPLALAAQAVQRNPDRYARSAVEWADLYLQYLRHPEDAKLNARLIQYYVNDRGDWTRALPHLKQHVAQYPNSAEAQVLLGVACLKNDDPLGAERHLQIAVNIQPANIDAHFYLGCSQLLQAKDADALGHFERTIQLDPQWQDAYVLLAAMHWLREDRAAARRISDQGLAAMPQAQALARLVRDVQQGGSSVALNHLKDILTVYLSQDPRPLPEAKMSHAAS